MAKSNQKKRKKISPSLSPWTNTHKIYKIRSQQYNTWCTVFDWEKISSWGYCFKQTSTEIHSQMHDIYCNNRNQQYTHANLSHLHCSWGSRRMFQRSQNGRYVVGQQEVCQYQLLEKTIPFHYSCAINRTTLQSCGL